MPSEGVGAVGVPVNEGDAIVALNAMLFVFVVTRALIEVILAVFAVILSVLVSILEVLVAISLELEVMLAVLAFTLV